MSFKLPESSMTLLMLPGPFPSPRSINMDVEFHLLVDTLIFNLIDILID